METDRDQRMMRRCLELAEESRCNGESAVGSLIVLDGEVLAEGLEATLGELDPTAHSELLAIRAACRTLGRTDLSGAEMFTTVEPCLSCAYAIRATGISRVVIGTDAGEIGTFGPGARHPFLADPGFVNWGPPPEVVMGVMADESRRLRGLPRGPQDDSGS
jgi:tRNA(adenine34) deaminase